MTTKEKKISGYLPDGPEKTLFFLGPRVAGGSRHRAAHRLVYSRINGTGPGVPAGRRTGVQLPEGPPVWEPGPAF